MADFRTELNRHIATLEACIGQTRGDTTPDPATVSEDWRSGWDADRAADREENLRWRQWL